MRELIAASGASSGASPARLDHKDAHDVYRLPRAVDTGVFVDAIERLQNDDVSAGVTREALIHLTGLFAAGPGARGSVIAGTAEEPVGDPVAVSESVALLAQDLVDELGS